MALRRESGLNHLLGGLAAAVVLPAVAFGLNTERLWLATMRDEIEAGRARLADGLSAAGYAVLPSGSIAGASSVAVPIRSQGRAIGSLSVFGPTPLIEADVRRVVPLLTAAANRIARQYQS